ncbi:MAG: type IX secretion system membrane protein PorP/SprF [Flavobacteriales bacterium]|nr:type IX secretion system membrane protein PorP/SprF [Flavobacteriales bacterium]
MKKLKIIIILSIISCNSIAQQDVQFSNYELYSSFYNPASITQTKYICGSLLARNQWTGFSGHPNTGNLSFAYNHHNTIWTGLSFLGDQLGFQNSNILTISVAKKFSLSTKTNFAFGINIKAKQLRLSAQYITPDTPYGLDPSIPNLNFKANNVDGDLGIWITHDNVYAGLSVTQFLQSQYSKNGYLINMVRHYYINAGYKKQLKWGQLDNSILAKSDTKSTQIDIKSNLFLNNGFMIGLGFRLSDAIYPIVGYVFRQPKYQLTFLYSYDITTSKIRSYSTGTHELGIKICMIPEIYTERHTHPRHLGVWK